MKSNNNLSIAVPTYNAGRRWLAWIDGYKRQDSPADEVLVIDSSSRDDTAIIAQDAGFRVVRIDPSEFNHGRTRQMAVELLSSAKYICFMTQDAVLATESSLSTLRRAFDNETVKAVFGRQLSFPHAGPLESFPRDFNYPEKCHVRTLAEARKIGIKATFFSNSFAAYERSALLEVGGFPAGTILGEDTYVAAKMLLAGMNVAYSAGATVYHSHDYGIVEEFRRYFDIGVFHAREAWILKEFGSPGSEGARYLRSELSFLAAKAPFLIPLAIMRSAAKFCGYRAGRLEHLFPVLVKERLSMHRGYWSVND